MEFVVIMPGTGTASDYKVDFTTMRQTNTDTGTMRRVRWQGGPWADANVDAETESESEGEESDDGSDDDADDAIDEEVVKHL